VRAQARSVRFEAKQNRDSRQGRGNLLRQAGSKSSPRAPNLPDQLDGSPVHQRAILYGPGQGQPSRWRRGIGLEMAQTACATAGLARGGRRRLRVIMTSITRRASRPPTAIGRPALRVSAGCQHRRFSWSPDSMMDQGLADEPTIRLMPHRQSPHVGNGRLADVVRTERHAPVISATCDGDPAAADSSKTNKRSSEPFMYPGSGQVRGIGIERTTKPGVALAPGPMALVPERHEGMLAGGRGGCRWA